jgi:hypothetical protein
MIQGECFIVTILIRLICTLFTLPPSSLPLGPLPTTLNAVARGFLVLFHRGIWSPSTLYRHLNLVYPPSPTSTPSTNTHCGYFTVLVFIINIWVDVQRGVSVCNLCGCALLWSLPSNTLPFPFTSHSQFFNIFHYTLEDHFCSWGIWGRKLLYLEAFIRASR